MLATLILAAGTVDYRVSVAPAPTAPVVTVAMTFTGDADGETEVDLPSKWAGSAELWRALGAPVVAGGALVRSADLEHWRIRHRPTLPADTIAVCGTLRTVEQPAYGRGFEIDDADRVTTVEPGSGAAAAGVRAGMTYVRRLSFTYLDASRPYVAEFADGGTTRMITFLPSLARRVRFQRLDRTGLDTPACRAAIAGATATP